MLDTPKNLLRYCDVDWNDTKLQHTVSAQNCQKQPRTNVFEVKLKLSFIKINQKYDSQSKLLNDQYGWRQHTKVCRKRNYYDKYSSGWSVIRLSYQALRSRNFIACADVIAHALHSIELKLAISLHHCLFSVTVHGPIDCSHITNLQYICFLTQLSAQLPGSSTSLDDLKCHRF